MIGVCITLMPLAYENRRKIQITLSSFSILRRSIPLKRSTEIMYRFITGLVSNHLKKC